MGWASTVNRVLRGTQRAFAGGAVVYTPPEGPAVTLTDAVFRETHEEATAEGVLVRVDRPVVSVVREDLPGGEPARNALVELADGRRFVVEDQDRDGEGGLLLLLAEVAP